LNGTLFFQQLFDFQLFNKQGITTELYVKSLTKNETTFFQRAKYTKVAQTYFVTLKGDTIYNITKNTWAIQVDVLDEMNFYLPLDSVIYDKKNPKDYQLISEFRNYSTVRIAIAYFIVGLIMFTIWLYFMTVILTKGLAKLRKE
jgi:hypothetical protein